MKNKVNILKCNRCAVNSCNKWVSKKGRDGWENIPLIDDSRLCTSFIEPDIFKMPFLTHLMADNKKSQAVYNILKSVHLRFQEKEHYPYFKLTVRNKE